MPEPFLQIIHKSFLKHSIIYNYMSYEYVNQYIDMAIKINILRLESLSSP